MSMLRSTSHKNFVLLLLLTAASVLSPLGIAAANHVDEQENNTPDQVSYIFVGVSGTLQDGFPLRDRLDYHDSVSTTKAIHVGKALVRGYKAYLDIKDEGWREYQPDLHLTNNNNNNNNNNNKNNINIIPNLNAVVIPSGCWEHANIYWVYLVDSRQIMSILLHEPRFLSITPDTGLVDLTASETSETIVRMARHFADRSNYADQQQVAIPLVTGVWHHESYIESPVMYTKLDGTQVTSFDQSLAIWANISAEEEVESDDDVAEECSKTDKDVCSAETLSTNMTPLPLKSAAYWDRVKSAIRSIPPRDDNFDNSGGLLFGHERYNCQRRARFGVGPDTARINYPLTLEDFESLISTA